MDGLSVEARSGISTRGPFAAECSDIANPVCGGSLSPFRFKAVRLIHRIALRTGFLRRNQFVTAILILILYLSSQWLMCRE